MFSKIGRWTAGRLQGSKGVQKYDGFMARNPWANTALNLAGGVALGAATGGIGALVGGKLGAGLAAAGKWGGRMGMVPGGAYSPGGAPNGGRGGSQLDQLNQMGMDELRGLRDAARGPQNTSIANDPLDGVSFDAPGGDLIDRAAGSGWEANTRFNGAIANDALDGYGTGGPFSGAIANDPMETLRGRAGSMFAPEIANDAMGEMGDISQRMLAFGDEAGGGAPGVGTSQVTADDLRTDYGVLDGFDADASFQRYATGANNRFMSSLQSGLDNLRNSAAGGNRLNTGFFDLDSGKLGRDLRQDAANDISAAALQTNAQNLQARTSAASLRTTENSAIRDARLRASTANADNALQAGIANARNALDGRRLRLDAMTSAGSLANQRAGLQRDDRAFLANRFDVQTRDLTSLRDMGERDRRFNADEYDRSQERTRLRAGMQRDDRRFNFDSEQAFLDRADKRTTNDRSTWLDAAAAKRNAWQMGNDARFKAADVRRGDRDFDENVYRDRRNSYLDMLSGMTDRAQGTQNARDARNANRTNSWMQLGGQIAGAGMNYLMNRRSGSGSGIAPRSGSSTTFAPINTNTPSAMDWDDAFRRTRPQLFAGN